MKSGRRGMKSGLPRFKEQFHPTRTLVVGTGGQWSNVKVPHLACKV
ncbi:MAG: hypothetical protein ACI3X8_08800 [Alloprevotella sp.]